MAKRRLLKKEISCIADFLFGQVLLLEVLGVDEEKVNTLLTRVVDMEEDFVKRAHQPTGKDNKKLVKQYYSKLIEDIQKEITAIEDEVEALSNEKAA